MTLTRRTKPLALLLLAALSSAGMAWAQPKEPSASVLDSTLFYQIVVGELSATQGDNASAFQLLLDAARKTTNPKLYERAVEIALRARAGDSALQAAQAWSKAIPSSREANRYVLQVLLSLNRTAETLEPLRRDLALQSPADRVGAITLLPRSYERATDKQLASSVVEQALALETSNPTTGPAAWFAIGTLRLAAGNTAAATEAAQKGLTLNPRAREPLLLAIGLMGPDNPGAQALVRKHLVAPVLPELRMVYVRKLLELQRSDEALSQLQTLTTESPGYDEAWLVLGSLQLQERQSEAAERALLQYLNVLASKTENAQAERERGRVQAYLLLAQIAQQRQQFDLAQTHLDKIGSTTDTRVVVRRASLLARQGQLARARELIQALPQNDADDARTKLSAEVQLLRDSKAYGEAHALLQQAYEKNPQDMELAYDLAMAAEKVGKVEEMERLLRLVIATKPDYHHAYNALGYSLADRKVRLDEARALIQKALAFAPQDPYIVDSLAWVEFRSGNLEEALRLLQQAFSTKPDAEIAAHLGEVLWALNRQNQARAIWAEGLALNPDNETLKDTMQRLSPQ